MNSSDSDDSVELPDLFEDKLNELKHVGPGDIVWAEFRQLHWPALVRTVYLKDRKMTVRYLDSPYKSFKLPWDKIKVFDDKNINEMIRKKASQSPFKDSHEKVVLRTLSYIRRQAVGLKDNPLEYFDSSYPYLCIKNSDISSPPSENQRISVREFSSGTDYVKDSDDEISDCDEDSVLASFSNMQEDLEAYDKETENKIVQYIKVGKVEKHLLGVQRGNIPSVFLDIFKESLESSTKRLFNINPCEHVRDPEKLREISSYLMDLYEKSVEGGKCVMHRFITAVWLPEAIDASISLIEEELESSNNISCTKRNLMTCESNSFNNERSVSKKSRKSKSNKVVEKITYPITKSNKTTFRKCKTNLSESDQTVVKITGPIKAKSTKTRFRKNN